MVHSFLARGTEVVDLREDQLIKQLTDDRAAGQADHLRFRAESHHITSGGFEDLPQADGLTQTATQADFKQTSIENMKFRIPVPSSDLRFAVELSSRDDQFAAAVAGQRVGQVTGLWFDAPP